MDKLRHLVRPYSFRAKMQLILSISVSLSCVLSLLCAYTYSRYNMRMEMAHTEYNLALSILELKQKTELSLQEIIGMAENEDLDVQVLAENGRWLNDAESRLLEEKTVITLMDGFSAMPSTYVKLDDNIVLRIFTSRKFNVFMNAFMRIGTVWLLFPVFFLAIAIFSAWRVSIPVTQLTNATQKVSGGDFTVKLPEDREDEIGTLMRSFNSMTDALQRTSWLQKDFIASVSHEFRTPIASIKGYARLLQMPELDEEKRREYVQVIAQESDRLSRLSETLLRLTALEQQTAPASLSTFQLDEQLREVILRLEPIWTAKEMNLDLNLDPVTIETDADLLTQVWVNIIQNAVKFSDQGGVLEIAVRQTDRAEVEITDHGIGMDEETLQRIFDRFYQADTSRSHEGVGLGLCLVKRILDILGGDIKIRSAVGEGTSIRVRMPYQPPNIQHKENEP